jgi:hypothetical protein
MQTGHPIVVEDEDRPPIIVNDKDNRGDPIVVDDEDIEGCSAIQNDEYQPTIVDDEDYPLIVDNDRKKDNVPRTRQQRDDPDKTHYTNAEDELEIKNDLSSCYDRIQRRDEENEKELEEVKEYLAILGR